MALFEPKTLVNVLKSDDTKVMLAAYDMLGVKYEILREDERSFDVRVDSEIQVNEAELFMNNAGTATRFMLPLLCTMTGKFVMTGNPRMLERPIGDLVDALKQLGAEIEYLGQEGFLPLRVTGRALSGSCLIRGDVSSQYLSGLLITQAFVGGFEVEIKGELVSKPYVDLTKAVINDFKASDTYEVEGDASSASYWWAIGAEVTNVPATTLQADYKFLAAKDLLPGKINCVEFPDSAMTLAVLAAITPGFTRLSGLSNLKYKECDRLHALETEINRVGGKAKAFDDGLEIEGVSELHGAQVETYDDHRMAMCMAVLKYHQPEIQILDPGCVSKTYPTFFDEFPV
jgi:3-phosphoshikimate 1-carboxyvinyltransferase